MSLTLLQGYSSAEEEEDESYGYDTSSGEEGNAAIRRNTSSYKPLLDPNPPSASALPSAFDAFSEVSGPPQFLNKSVQEEEAPKEDVGRWRHGVRRNRKEKKHLPTGAVIESKAQLDGIHERVRSDIGKEASSQGQSNGGKRVVTAQNPNAEDAAELLRMCLRCGVPKTFSSGKGIVCPICNDRPLDSDTDIAKKKGSTIKDKEKNKRMKGQSSHATWKSETEMQLRQQFD